MISQTTFPNTEVLDYTTDPRLSREVKSFLKKLNGTDAPPIETLSPIEARKVLYDAQASVVVDLSGIEEAEKINEKLTSSSFIYTGTTLSYTTNPQAIYTSRLLNFNDLPEPKNAIDNKNNDNSFEVYSGNYIPKLFYKSILEII